MAVAGAVHEDLPDISRPDPSGSVSSGAFLVVPIQPDVTFHPPPESRHDLRDRSPRGREELARFRYTIFLSLRRQGH
jgi:hypothetical protein